MVEKRFNYRHLIYAIYDFATTFGIVYLSFLTFLFRSEPLSATQTWWMFGYCAGVALLTVIVFLCFRIYKIVTIYFSFHDGLKVGIITGAIHIVGLIVLLCIPKDLLVRPSIAAWALASLSLVCVVLGLRIFVRWGNNMFHFSRKNKRVRTIIVGAGAAGKFALEDAKTNKNNYHKVVLFLDDDPNKIGGVHASVPIRGPINQLPYFIEKYRAEEVILAISKLPRERMEEMTKL